MRPSVRHDWDWLWPMTMLVCCGAAAGAREPLDVLDIEPVWAGHPVGFALLTHPPYQYVAYYDASRQMSVAERTLDDRRWKVTRLDSFVKWDSHNYVTMALDGANQIHLAGNMHCDPLVYYRTTKPWQASSLERISEMVGPEREKRVTYPVFMRGPEDRLIFRYRDGRSGSGDDIYNEYDEAARCWRRLLDQPLTSGQGKMNAYCSRPQLGPDGYYHIVWVWRDTPDCATNHDLSYARSRDLVHWETAAGQPLTLPITLDDPTIVDPAGPHGGLINGGFRLGFDNDNRPVVVYHKYDPLGHTQVYAARFEKDQWRVRQISQWRDYRWEFSGGGSIPFEVRINSVGCLGTRLRVDCTYGRGRERWDLDANTLEPLTEGQGKEVETDSEAQWQPTRTTFVLVSGTEDNTREHFPGLELRVAADSGPGERKYVYRLEWCTLGKNRDKPRSGPLPPPSMLRVLKFSR